MNKDHQQFEEIKLANGITIYLYTGDFRIANLEVRLPYGSAQSIPENNLDDGAVHFLEHMMCLRTQNYPQAYQIDNIIADNGGHSGASTHPCHMIQWMDMPVRETRLCIDLLIERVFYPIFNLNDIEIERSVIINERDKRKFYPGVNEATQYLYTKVIDDKYFPHTRIFGSDLDLLKFDVKYLQKAHKTMLSKEIVVLAVIPESCRQHLIEELGKVKTHSKNIITEVDPTTWVRKDFHEVYMDSIPQTTYKVLWVNNKISWQDYYCLAMLIYILTNPTFGVLFMEYRGKKGWVYGVEANNSTRINNHVLQLTFQVNDKSYIKKIDANLFDLIYSLIDNQEIIEKGIRRSMKSMVYDFQTPTNIISSASNSLNDFGKIISEKEWTEAVSKLKDKKFRQNLICKYFPKDNFGSVAFIPERREKKFARDLTTN